MKKSAPKKIQRVEVTSAAKKVKALNRKETIRQMGPKTMEARVIEMMFGGPPLTAAEQTAFFRAQKEKLDQILKLAPDLPRNGIKRQFRLAADVLGPKPKTVQARFQFLSGTPMQPQSWYTTAVDAGSTLDWVMKYLARLGEKLPPLEQRALFMAFYAGAKLCELLAGIKAEPRTRQPSALPHPLWGQIREAAASWRSPENSKRTEATAKDIRAILIERHILTEWDGKLLYRGAKRPKPITEKRFENIVTDALKVAAAGP